MHYYKDLGDGHLMEIIGGDIPADAIESAEPIVYEPPIVPVAKPYVPTDTELLARAKQSKLWRIKELLTATDYKCLKFVDGELTESEYTETKAYRAGLRAAYNAVEAAVSVAEVDAVEV